MNIRVLKLPDQKEWKPVTPKKLLEYIHKDVTFAQTNDKLLGIVIESLERLNERLHGVTPMVPFLWNDIGNNKWRPKNENKVSDFVKDHLQTDLAGKVIVDREVEVTNLNGKGVGERIDILVQATGRDKNNHDVLPLSIAIEAKGCWNEKLKTAMKEQLVEQYLIDSQHTHGIYLVYWFLCDKWDTKHNYKKNCESHFKTQEELEDFLSKQAKELSVHSSKKITSYVLDCSVNKNRD